MRDSGVEWLREIPAHWEVKRNGLLFRERDERGFSELPILNVSINTGVAIREFSEEKIEQKAEDPAIYKRAKQGDIAFNKMRMWQGAVGVAPVDGLVSPDYTVATPDPRIEPVYYELLFRTSFYKAEINRHSHGNVPDRNRLYWDEFKQIKSLFPPPDEQRRILNWINAETEKLDALVSKILDGIARLKEFRTALISAAVTGKIDVREEVP
jgi:type I restriction enzyme, S subunit